MDEEEVQLLQHSVIGICHRRASFISEASRAEYSTVNSRSSSFNEHDCSLYSEELSNELDLDEFAIDEILSDDDTSVASNNDSINIKEVLEGIDLNFKC